MRWREHLVCDVEMIADGLRGLGMTLGAMLFGERRGPYVVMWRGMMWNMGPRKADDRKEPGNGA